MKNNKVKNKENRTCQICGIGSIAAELRPGVLVRPDVSELIIKDRGTWDEQGWICIKDLQHYRHEYVEAILRDERGEVTAIDREVIESLKNQDILSKNPIEGIEATSSFGERLADRIADFGGSWSFISLFGVVLFVWMLLNSCFLLAHPFDPYPFILLNLVLSSLAAIQAPVIMMSQNRQESRDRIRATYDYQINLKAELEIRHLNQKIDHLMSHQWERLVAIQDIQMELIDEIRTGKEKTS